MHKAGDVGTNGPGTSLLWSAIPASSADVPGPGVLSRGPVSSCRGLGSSDAATADSSTCYSTSSRTKGRSSVSGTTHSHARPNADTHGSTGLQATASTRCGVILVGHTSSHIVTHHAILRMHGFNLLYLAWKSSYVLCHDRPGLGDVTST